MRGFPPPWDAMIFADYLASGNVGHTETSSPLNKTLVLLFIAFCQFLFGIRSEIENRLETLNSQDQILKPTTKIKDVVISSLFHNKPK